MNTIPDMKTRQISSSGGCTIELRDFGGDGPDLIICHATGFHGGAYAPMAKDLSASFRVWALDFRGHGASSAPANGDFAWSGMADDLFACISAIGVESGAESIVAFGHSLGGAVTLLSERAHPGLIRAAYLYEPIVFPKDLLMARTGNPMSGPARRRREVFDSKAHALYHYASKPPLNVLRADALAAYVEHGFEDLDDGTIRLTCRGENEARSFECEEKMTLEQLDGLELPVTIAVGYAEGNPTPSLLAPAVAETLSNGVLVRHPHLGHFGPLEAPRTIAADVISVLGEA